MNKRKIARIKPILQELEALITVAKQEEKHFKKELAKVQPLLIESARNLLHYKAVRRKDMREVNKRLGNLGLSRLARSQGHIMYSLMMTRSLLESALDGDRLTFPRKALGIKRSDRLIRRNAKELFGYRSRGRQTRIMVTMPTEAATNCQLVNNLILNGMNCARINCAHDHPEVWLQMINNIRKASVKNRKKCKIAMDLGGPKIRTGNLQSVPGVIKFRPTRNKRGEVIQPSVAWLGPQVPEDSSLSHIPVAANYVEKLREGTILYFKDTRNKKRQIQLVKKEKGGFIAHGYKTYYLETGMKLYTDSNRLSKAVRVGPLPYMLFPLVLKPGDLLRLDRSLIPGGPALYDEERKMIAPPHISCTLPAVFKTVKEGQTILFDDGKISGQIKKIKKEYLLIEILHARKRGAKLAGDKGINFPESLLQLRGLTQKDKKDLRFIVQHADIINMSFVNKVEDVRDLIAEIRRFDLGKQPGIVLKIETKSGYNQLPAILLEAMKYAQVGVMIARGDLAIEVGWENIARVQSEIMALCHAGHIPVIWATQVLENLAKKGIPSRAEITDVAMSQRADCVMLNKGPYIQQAVQLLGKILCDLAPFREKNGPVWPAFQELP